ncbi:MAG: hypothetical protein ACYTBV_05440, partial [Planctomycetota bacterium]
PETIHDPNDDGDKAQIHAEARLAADMLQAETKIIVGTGTASSGGPDKKLGLEAAILDDLYDIAGPVDPCDSMYGYCDIQSVSLTGSGLSEPNSQTTIRFVLNGVFPGTEPNPLEPPNLDRAFDALYSLIIDNSGPDGEIFMRVWRENPAGPTYTYAWYEGPNSGHVGSLLVLDNEIIGDPNELGDPTIISNQTLELTVSTDQFFEPGSEPFEDHVYLSAQSLVDDGGSVINDLAEDDTGQWFDLNHVLPSGTPGIFVIGPAEDANSFGLGVTGQGLSPDTLVEVNLDNEYVGSITTDEFGDFLYYIDPTLTSQALELEQPHLVEAVEIDELGDTKNTQSIALEFNYLTEEPVEGDIDEDGDVDSIDFAKFANNWLVGI